MLCQLRTAAGHVFLSLILVFALSLSTGAQKMCAPKGPTGADSDALPFLNHVFEVYANATSYRLESVEETTDTGEFSRSWEKSLTTAIVGFGNQFRFEIHGNHGSGLQISNGKVEWIYYPPFQQYTQHAAPTAGPSLIKAPVPGLYALNGAQRMLKSLSGLQKLVRTAAYAGDQTIDLNGSSVPCKVIKTEGELPGALQHITTRFNFWIDQHTHVIRKMTELREGPLRPDQPDANYIMQRTTLFLVADLALASAPESMFTFTPPLTASLVEKFEDRMSSELREFIGKQLPDISLKAADGKDVPLKSFQGKPMLLDFWATWCLPCVESLPTIEKLYRETADKGLTLVSIDQDEDPNKAHEFWRKHNEPWPNFHAGTEILGHFPEHGIPYFVLIDASGQVAFSASGLDETALRAALAKLNPAFRSASRPQAP